jgi:hypothetical protein
VLECCSVDLNYNRADNRHGLMQLVQQELLSKIVRAAGTGPKIAIILHSLTYRHDMLLSLCHAGWNRDARVRSE